MFRNKISFSLATSAVCLLFVFFGSGVLHVLALSDGSPTAPTNVRATAYTSSSPRVVISWNQALDNIGVTRYNIYKNGTFMVSPSGVGVTFTDFDVIQGATYKYSIQAGDGDGNNSPQSDTIEILANDGAVSYVSAPSQVTSSPSSNVSIQQTTTVFSNTGNQGGSPQITHPENIGMIAYDDRLVITWKNPIGNTFKSVRVIKKATSPPLAPTDGAVVCDGLVIQCVDKEVVSGKTYYYGVYAVDQSYLASKLVTVSGSLVEKKSEASVPQKIVVVGVPPTNLSSASLPLVTSAASFTKTLTLGSVNQEVLLLQRFLNTHGFIIATSGPGSQGNETSSFGKATEKALRAYQCSKKIVCAGTSASTGYGIDRKSVV